MRQIFSNFTIVKLLTLILSIYIIALACIPCTDATIVIDNAQTAHHHTDNSDHSDDSCTPFCICSCCGALIYNFSQTLTFTPTLAFLRITSPTPVFTANLNSIYEGSIWQPPQLL